MNRKRHANGNLYPLSFADRRRRANHRGSYKLHEEEFPYPGEFQSFTDADEPFEYRKATTWERIANWFARTFGGSYPGGDRLL